MHLYLQDNICLWPIFIATASRYTNPMIIYRKPYTMGYTNIQSYNQRLSSIPRVRVGRYPETIYKDTHSGNSYTNSKAAEISKYRGIREEAIGESARNGILVLIPI
jgi:hypothetical protein